MKCVFNSATNGSKGIAFLEEMHFYMSLPGRLPAGGPEAAAETGCGGVQCASGLCVNTGFAGRVAGVEGQ